MFPSFTGDLVSALASLWGGIRYILAANLQSPTNPPPSSFRNPPDYSENEEKEASSQSQSPNSSTEEKSSTTPTSSSTLSLSHPADSASDIQAILMFPADAWQKWLASLPWMSPSSDAHPLIKKVSAWILRTTIVPSTNVTPLSVEFQVYLMVIFHETWWSFAIHGVTMPLVISVTTQIVGKALLCSLLAVCWTSVAVYSGRLLWAVVNCIVAALIYVSADTLEAYQPLPTVPLLAVMSLTSAISHGPEELYPPRAADELGMWVPLRDLIAERGLISVSKSVTFSILCGAVQEFIASFRVFTVFTLKFLVFCGYEDTVTVKVHRVAHVLMMTGHAAVDFIGFSADQARAMPVDQFRRLLALNPQQRINHFRHLVATHPSLQQLSNENVQMFEATLLDPSIWPDVDVPKRGLVSWFNMVSHGVC